MFVVLDSTVLCRDFRMGGTAFRILQEGAHLVPAELRIPEVVIDETVNKYRERLDAELRKMIAAHRELANLLPSAPTNAAVGINAKAEADHYRDWLIDLFRTLRWEVLPYPTVEHKRVVSHALQRRKPFSHSGSGYRDYLIWPNIWELSIHAPQRIIFVTSNKRDFGEGPKLPMDLQSEVYAPDRIEIVEGLQTFVDRFIIPQLKSSEAMKKKLEHTKSSFDVSKWFAEILRDMLYDDPGLGDVVSIPLPVRVYPSRIIRFEEVAIEDVRTLPDGQHMVLAHARAELDLSVSVSWQNYVESRQVREWMGPQSEPFDSADWNEAHVLTIGARLIIDAEGDDVTDYEVVFVEGPSGRVEYV